MRCRTGFCLADRRSMARINEMAGRSQGQTLQEEDYFHIVAYQPALS